MGSLLSRFRKQPTTLEQLKKIEDGLRKIDDYKRNTERKQKKTVANVIIYGAALYILACVIVFVWYLPESWLVRLGLLVPLVMVPVIIYWMKRLISRYFQSKMVRANEDYADLQRKKKDIIDNVMETETYNKAKEILSRYAPEKLEKKLQERLGAPVIVAANTSTTDLKKRSVPNTSTSTLSKRVSPIRHSSRVPPPSIMAPPPIKLSAYPAMRPNLRMPGPLFPKDRSFSDKLVDYIIGDGPNYRYALICKFCQGHNGMALPEEFPYMAFTCCYCMMCNQARAKRLTAPRLIQSSDPEFRHIPAIEHRSESKLNKDTDEETNNVQSSDNVADGMVTKETVGSVSESVPDNELENNSTEIADSAPVSEATDDVITRETQSSELDSVPDIEIENSATEDARFNEDTDFTQDQRYNTNFESELDPLNPTHRSEDGPSQSLN